MMKTFRKCLAVVLVSLLLTACGENHAEPAAAEWSRQGSFEDGNGNYLLITRSDTEGYEGWGVTFMLDGEMIGWVIQQEGNTLHGNLRGWDENEEPFIVTVSEEGEEGLLLTAEGGETYRFTPIDMPKATISVSINVNGWGSIAFAEGEIAPELDPEYPAGSAQIDLAEPAAYTLAAWPDAGARFVKWTKNGEDFSAEPQITVLLDESADFVAVFEEDPDWQNPVMNFVGEYQCGEAHAQVECFGSEEAWITIEQGSSAQELTRWIIVGRLDTDTLSIAYSDGTKSVVVCDDNGEVKSEETEYADGTGTVVFREEGSFIWHEDSSEPGRDLVFEWLPTGES